ncbi:MAG: carbohydrate kinase [Desulfobacteraceae bacterium]|jgi:fructokinase|nr:MAG: carbohydrate kinase [Desulfobacteraceae bacterium]
MIIAPGEILLDVFPNYRRIGGAPFNFAYHLHRFGLPVRFVSRVGRDADGEYIRSRLKTLNFDDRFIQTDAVHPTGRVNVVMEDDGSHRFEILPDTAYDHIVLDDMFPDTLKNDKSAQCGRKEMPGGGSVDSSDAGTHVWSAGNAEMIYFGTLAQRTPESYSRVQKFLAGRPASTTTFFDINLRPVTYPDGVITSSLEQADILKLNDQELFFLQYLFNRQHQETDAFAAWLMNNFGIEWIALTRGEKGSRLYTRGGIRETVGLTSANVVDTVGAGDAYAAVLALGYLRRWPIDKILQAASAFAADICGISGAVPEDAEFYKPFLAS